MELFWFLILINPLDTFDVNIYTHSTALSGEMLVSDCKSNNATMMDQCLVALTTSDDEERVM